MAEPKESGAMFMMGLGERLGELKANQEAILGRIEALEEIVHGGGQQQQQGQQADGQAQQLAMVPQGAPVAKTPLDTFTHFTGETGKLLAGISDLKKIVTEYGPMLASLKSMAPTTPATTQTAQPVAAPATSAQSTAAPVSVFQPQGNA
jgi:hypothetical protein